ncbi:hypothetical protein [Clavibacter zhangzhiyongii]|uniref:hypothetical protein n=1 Tax=Clavibacter zhangzhiyongii TaxID=2768071 RepID=UPI0039E0BD7C
MDALTLTKDASKLVVGGRFTQLSGVPTYGPRRGRPGLGRLAPVGREPAGAQRRRGVLDHEPLRHGRPGVRIRLHVRRRRQPRGRVLGGPEHRRRELGGGLPRRQLLRLRDRDRRVRGRATRTTAATSAASRRPSPWTFQHSIAFSKQATGTATADPYGYHNWAGTPSPTLLNWFPKYVTGSFTGQGQAAWSVNGNQDYIVVGGEFPYVNTTAQQGLVRYATAKDAPNRIGPNGNDQLVPKTVSYTKGEARVAWQATFDRDSTRLTYKVIRDGKTATPVYQVTQDSTFWQRPSMGFVDKGLVPGSSHTYKVVVTGRQRQRGRPQQRARRDRRPVRQRRLRHEREGRRRDRVLPARREGRHRRPRPRRVRGPPGRRRHARRRGPDRRIHRHHLLRQGRVLRGHAPGGEVAEHLQRGVVGQDDLDLGRQGRRLWQQQHRHLGQLRPHGLPRQRRPDLLRRLHRGHPDDQLRLPASTTGSGTRSSRP